MVFAPCGNPRAREKLSLPFQARLPRAFPPLTLFGMGHDLFRTIRHLISIYHPFAKDRFPLWAKTAWGFVRRGCPAEKSLVGRFADAAIS